MEYNAIVRFLGKNEGGRITPPRAGFKPHLKIGNEFTSCIVKTNNTMNETMEFGVDYSVTIELVFPEIYKDRITKGMKVELFEGSKLIGVGYLSN